MIAKPLVWEKDGEWSCYTNECIYCCEARGITAEVLFVAEVRRSARKGFDSIGAFPTMAEAKAACERHHQKEFVRKMSQEARDFIHHGIAQSYPTLDARTAVDLIDEVNAEESQ